MPPTIESLLLQDPSSDGIDLATSKNSSIPNVVAPPICDEARRKYKTLRKRFPNWRNRRSACGRYNCYGHVFASRRTTIYDDKFIYRILEEDGFTEIGLTEMAKAGDIVLYRLRNGIILHAGQVVDATPDKVVILSKWDDSMGEDFHLATDVPKIYLQESPAQYWTDRHREDK